MHLSLVLPGSLAIYFSLANTQHASFLHLHTHALKCPCNAIVQEKNFSWRLVGFVFFFFFSKTRETALTVVEGQADTTWGRLQVIESWGNWENASMGCAADPLQRQKGPSVMLWCSVSLTEDGCWWWEKVIARWQRWCDNEQGGMWWILAAHRLYWLLGSGWGRVNEIKGRMRLQQEKESAPKVARGG